jgi:hypothetical protein
MATLKKNVPFVSYGTQEWRYNFRVYSDTSWLHFKLMVQIHHQQTALIFPKRHGYVQQKQSYFKRL